MSGGGNSSHIVLGAIAAVVLLAGAWYTATLRTQNAMLREQIASYESTRESDDVQPEPLRKSGPAPPVTAAAYSKPQRMLSDEEVLG